MDDVDERLPRDITQQAKAGTVSQCCLLSMEGSRCW